MSDCGCNKKISEGAARRVGVCTACWLLEGRATPQVVTYCGACKAWLCARCKWDPVRRMRAALRRLTTGNQPSKVRLSRTAQG